MRRSGRPGGSARRRGWRPPRSGFAGQVEPSASGSQRSRRRRSEHRRGPPTPQAAEAAASRARAWRPCGPEPPQGGLSHVPNVPESDLCDGPVHPEHVGVLLHVTVVGNKVANEGAPSRGHAGTRERGVLCCVARRRECERGAAACNCAARAHGRRANSPAAARWPEGREHAGLGPRAGRCWPAARSPARRPGATQIAHGGRAPAERAPDREEHPFCDRRQTSLSLRGTAARITSSGPLPPAKGCHEWRFYRDLALDGPHPVGGDRGLLR